MGFFKKLRKRISKLKRIVKCKSTDATRPWARCVGLKEEITELNRQLGQVINHYSEAVQQLNCANAIGQFQSYTLVSDLNQQLLPRVDSLSKQLAELCDATVSPSAADEINNISDFEDREQPGEISDEIQSEGEKEENYLSQSSDVLMEESYLNAPINGEVLPAILINESNCSQSGGVPLCLITNKDRSTETKSHGDTPYYEEACVNIMEEDPLSGAKERCYYHESSKGYPVSQPEDEVVHYQLWCSSNDMQNVYVNQSGCSAEHQYESNEEESHKESIHPSTVMADPSEPHESTVFAELHGFESAYTARVNELESFLRSVEESEEHDSKQTKVAPSAGP